MSWSSLSMIRSGHQRCDQSIAALSLQGCAYLHTWQEYIVVQLSCLPKYCCCTSSSRRDLSLVKDAGRLMWEFVQEHLVDPFERQNDVQLPASRRAGLKICTSLHQTGIAFGIPAQ